MVLVLSSMAVGSVVGIAIALSGVAVGVFLGWLWFKRIPEDFNAYTSR
jgi:membrane associated rhomboid family serine protease